MPAFRRVNVVLLAALCLLASAAAAWGQDKTYPIKLDRPLQVGNKFKVQGKAVSEAKTTVTVGGQAQAPIVDAYTVVYEGQYEVLAVTADNMPLKVAVTFAKFEIAAAGATTSPIPAGGVVTMERKKGEVVYDLKDGQLSPQTIKAMSDTDLAPSGEALDDIAFGTKVPQKVGSQWPVNAEGAAKNLQTKGFKVEPKDIKGQVTLAGVKTQGQIPCLQLNIEMTIEKFVPAPDKLPPGIQVNKATVAMKTTGLLPEDATLPSLHVTADFAMTMELTMPQPGAPAPVSVSVVAKTKMEGEMTPVKQ